MTPDQNMLIARVEGASEGSRELDAAIWTALTGEQAEHGRDFYQCFRLDDHEVRYYLPRLTTSVDDALALAMSSLFPGAHYALYTSDGDEKRQVLGPYINGKALDSRAATLPLCICLAMLKHASGLPSILIRLTKHVGHRTPFLP